MSGLLAAVFNGAQSLLNTHLSNASYNNATKKAYKYNMQMWNAQNEYNLPVNQMKRLRAAGLNPNLVYGHGTSTLASTPSSAGTPSRLPYQLDTLASLNAYQDLRQKDATTQNIIAQEQVIKAQQREIDARTKNVKADTAIKRHNYGIVKGTPLFVGEGGTVSQVGRGVKKSPDLMEQFFPSGGKAHDIYQYYRRHPEMTTKKRFDDYFFRRKR